MQYTTQITSYLEYRTTKSTHSHIY